jgi:hypothetical protein
MRTIVIRHGDPRKEKITTTVRNDISDEPGETGTISYKQFRMIKQLRGKKFSDWTEEERLEYEKLFSNNDTEEEN